VNDLLLEVSATGLDVPRHEGNLTIQKASDYRLQFHSKRVGLPDLSWVIFGGGRICVQNSAFDIGFEYGIRVQIGNRMSMTWAICGRA